MVAAGGARLDPQTPAEVAALVADLLDRPRAELYTHPAQPAVVVRYHADVGGFDAGLEPGP